MDPAPSWPEKHPWLCALLLALVAMGPFFRGLTFPFVNYDDNVYVYANAHVMAGLTWESICWSFTAVDGGNWHPLTWLSLLFDSSLGAKQPWAFHLSSILLHGASAATLFLALRVFTGRFWPSFWVALLWAVHPLRTESVVWIAERKDTLSGLFFMLTLLAYAHYARQKSWPRYLLVLLAFLMGLMAKPMLVTLPCVLLLLDVWPLVRHRSESWGRLILEKLPMLPLVIAICAITFRIQREGGMMVDFIPLSSRVANAIVAYAAYLGQLFWPFNLAVLYPTTPEFLPTATVACGAIVLIAITAVAVWGWRRSHLYIPIGWLWYLGMLVPVIGLIQVGGQTMADRYTYLPMIGILIAIVWAVADAVEVRSRWANRAAVLAGLGAVAASIAITFPTVNHWQSSTALWRQAVAVSPNTPLPNAMLASAFVSTGRFQEAQQHAAKATRLAPDVWFPQYILAWSLAEQRLFQQALAPARRACELAPDEPLPWIVYAQSLEKTGHLKEALAACRQSVKASPQNGAVWIAHQHLGRLLSDFNNHEEAAQHFAQAVKFVPDEPGPRYGLAFSLAQLHRNDEARKHYLTLLAIPGLSPQTPEAAWSYNGLGTLEANAGRWAKAADYFAQSVRLAPRDSLALINLAAALEKTGDTPGAIDALRRALEIDPADADAKTALKRLAARQKP